MIDGAADTALPEPLMIIAIPVIYVSGVNIRAACRIEIVLFILMLTFAADPIHPMP